MSRLSTACVSCCWCDCMPLLPALYFEWSAFNARGITCADTTIGRMVHATSHLEELIIYFPLYAVHFPCWLAMRSTSLCVLELWVDSSYTRSEFGSSHLDCVSLVPNLEEMRLSGLTMTCWPAWG
ncbi:hypothetical protein ZWY2020_047162 [Hordeum vulgare]|nr:hypothetical protein ZWY2020_047162 [Hordeum vulgare]